MRKEYALKNATFVYSKKELGYAPLLEEMKQAKEITIVTYNISEKQEELLKYLKSAPDDCDISIITNIPGRWKTYLGDQFRTHAHQKVKVYMTKLAPENFEEKVSVYISLKMTGVGIENTLIINTICSAVLPSLNWKPFPMTALMQRVK